MDENIKKLEESKKQLDNLKTAFAEIEKGFKALVKPKIEIKADGMKDGPSPQDCMNYIDSQSKYFWQAISNLQQTIYSTQNQFYGMFADHTSSHLPKLTASQMQKMLDSCGAGSDYEIKKPQLYISSAKTLRGSVITISNKNAKAA